MVQRFLNKCKMKKKIKKTQNSIKIRKRRTLKKNFFLEYDEISISVKFQGSGSINFRVIA